MPNRWGMVWVGVGVGVGAGVVMDVWLGGVPSVADWVMIFWAIAAPLKAAVAATNSIRRIDHSFVLSACRERSRQSSIA